MTLAHRTPLGSVAAHAVAAAAFPPSAPPALTTLVSRALGVDQTGARRVLRASRGANRRFQHDYDRLARTPAAVPPALDWAGATVWSRALKADGRPLILATLHLGCYLSALLALADHLRWLGRITVIRRRRDDPREHDAQLNFLRIGLELVVVRTRDHPARAALRALRRGEHVLLLYDVPPGFDVGRTEAAPFLGLPAHMASGPAQLAAHADALLWPFAIPMIDGTLRMRTREPLAPGTKAACQAATRALARFAEDCILEAPEQWLLWTHLPALWGLNVPAVGAPAEGTLSGALPGALPGTLPGTS